jgi:hypothetical protein
MEANPPNQASAPSSSTGYYVWSPADKNYTVYLNVGLIDRLNFDVMRGFGAVPKRGAEIGGLLLGSVKPGDELVIRVDEFVTVPSEHLRGPSYILSENDLHALDTEIARSSRQGTHQVVGFFRSNTREILQLVDEDRALLDSRFPAESALCLLIKPYTTRPCEATFIVREDGAFPQNSRYQTFTFRRKDLGGTPGSRRERGRNAPREESAQEAGASAAQPFTPPARHAEAAFPAPAPEHNGYPPQSTVETPVSQLERPIGSFADLPVPVDEALRAGRRRRSERLRQQSAAESSADPGADAFAAQNAVPSAAPAPRRYRWIWLPISLIFLLLGVVIGTQVTLTIQRAQNAAMNGDPYELDLTVSHFGSSFMLKWNPNQPALRQADRAELHIEEGQATRTKLLSADDLAHGSVILTGAKENVRFRMTLFLRGRCTFSETVEASSATP